MYVPMNSSHLVGERQRVPNRSSTPGVLDRLRNSRTASLGGVQRSASSAAAPNPSRVASVASNRGSVFGSRSILNGHSLRRFHHRQSAEISSAPTSLQDESVTFRVASEVARIEEEAGASQQAQTDIRKSIYEEADVDKEKLSFIQALLSTEGEVPQTLEPTTNDALQSTTSPTFKTDVDEVRETSTRPTVKDTSTTEAAQSIHTSIQDYAMLVMDDMFRPGRLTSPPASDTSSLRTGQDPRLPKSINEITLVDKKLSPFPFVATVKRFDCASLITQDLRDLVTDNPHLDKACKQLKEKIVKHEADLLQQTHKLEGKLNFKLSRDKTTRNRIRKRAFDSQTMLVSGVVAHDNLDMHLNKLHNDKARLQHKVGKLEQDLKMVTDLNISNAKAYDLLNIEKEDLEASIDSLRENIEELQADVEYLQYQEIDLRNHVEDLQYQKIDLQNNVEGQQEEIRTRQQHIQGLRYQIEGLNDQIDSMYDEMERYKNRNQVLKNKVVDLQDHNLQLEQDLKVSNNTREALEEERAQDIRRSLTRFHRDANETNDRIRGLVQQLEQKTLECDKLKHDRDSQAGFVNQLKQGYTFYRSYWHEHDRLYKAYFNDNHSGRVVKGMAGLPQNEELATMTVEQADDFRAGMIKHGVSTLRHHYLQRRNPQGEPLNPVSGADFLDWLNRNCAVFENEIGKGNRGKHIINFDSMLDEFPMPPTHSRSGRRLTFMLGDEIAETGPSGRIEL